MTFPKSQVSKVIAAHPISAQPPFMQAATFQKKLILVVWPYVAYPGPQHVDVCVNVRPSVPICVYAFCTCSMLYVIESGCVSEKRFKVNWGNPQENCYSNRLLGAPDGLLGESIMPGALATTDCAWFQLQWICPSGALSLLQLRGSKASPGPVHFMVFSMLLEAAGKTTG